MICGVFDIWSALSKVSGKYSRGFSAVGLQHQNWIARLSFSQIKSWVALSFLVVCSFVPSVPPWWHLNTYFDNIWTYLNINSFSKFLATILNMNINSKHILPDYNGQWQSWNWRVPHGSCWRVSPDKIQQLEYVIPMPVRSMPFQTLSIPKIDKN